MSYAYVAVPVLVYVALSVVELVRSRKLARPIFSWGDTAINLTMFAFSQSLILGFGLAFHIEILPDHRAWSEFQVRPSEILLALVAVDFVYYWKHRLMHSVRALWAFHSVHHSSQYLNPTTALRFDWLGELLNLPVLAGVAAMGLSPLLYLQCYSALLVFGFWTHMSTVPEIAWLEGWLNTPSGHRVHHSIEESGSGQNLGGFTLVWDRLFGTYQPEDRPIRYGVESLPPSLNPLQVAFGGVKVELQTRFRSQPERGHTADHQ